MLHKILILFEFVNTSLFYAPLVANEEPGTNGNLSWDHSHLSKGKLSRNDFNKLYKIYNRVLDSVYVIV